MSILDFLRDELPARFERGVAALADDDEKSELLDDVKAAEGWMHVELLGEGEVCLEFADGEIEVLDEPDDDEPPRLHIQIPGEAATLAFDELLLSGELDREDADIKLALSASKKAQEAIGDDPLVFHVILKDVPDLDEVILKIGLNSEDPPESPTFTATVSYEALEDLRDEGGDASQLLMGGKIRFAGNYAPALQIGMRLAALAKARASAV